MKLLREWKKVLEADLPSVITEIKDSLSSPATIILTGDLGAGKTSLTKVFLASELDNMSSSDIQSPTYSVVNEVDNIVHADFYRLNSEDEIIHLELPLYLEDKEYFIVEWGKKYLKEIYQYCPSDFNYFEIIIESNDKENSESSRNYALYKLNLV